jgi:hypothetical protein
MKINEIITEDLDPSEEVNNSGLETKAPPKHHSAPIKNATTYPGQNSSTGSAYMNYRFGVALAGAPDFPADAEPWIGGDPLLAPYSKEEMRMMDAAAKMVGDTSKRTHSSSKSKEQSDTNKASIVNKPKKNKYGV